MNSKRKVEMIDTEQGTTTSKTRWKCSFNLMQKELTDAQKKATAKFMEDKHVIRVVVKKSKADEYKAKAESAGKSLNQYIIDCIERW